MRGIEFADAAQVEAGTGLISGRGARAFRLMTGESMRYEYPNGVLIASSEVSSTL